jgi:uncharacterized membrane protein SpoIIM required for sporulation
MREKYIKYSYILFLIIFVISFSIGLFLVENKEINNKYLLPNFQLIPKSKIFTNNILLAISLLIGFITINIQNYILIFYNGILFGIKFSILKNKIGIEKSLVTFLPHGIIELIWFIILSSLSVKLSFLLYDYIKSDFTKKIFLKELFSKKTFLYFSIVFLGILVEIYLTPLLINLIY